jgi:hypothetical protein
VGYVFSKPCSYKICAVLTLALRTSHYHEVADRAKEILPVEQATDPVPPLLEFPFDDDAVPKGSMGRLREVRSKPARLVDHHAGFHADALQAAGSNNSGSSLPIQPFLIWLSQ